MSTEATMTSEPAAASLTGHRLGWVFLSLTRIAIGFIFLWAFFDKLLGLGYSTCRTTAEDGSYTIDVMCDSAWINGARITEGYLVYAGNPNSPFNDFFTELGGQAWTDWPFMLGLLGIGFALCFGVGTKVAMFAGPLMLTFMYMTQMPPVNNPILDDHLVQALAIIGIVLVELGHQSIGLGEWWKRKVGVKHWTV
jgi:thiosulfate dehydrogenase [quinone] large subunit